MAEHAAPMAVPTIRIDYGQELEREIGALEQLVADHVELAGRPNSRWLAIKLLEGDERIRSEVAALGGTAAIRQQTAEATARLESLFGDSVETLVADGRYGWINGLVRETVERPSIDRLTLSDRIDAVVTHRTLGIPIFLAMMWVVFKMTTDVSAPYISWIELVVSGPLSRWMVAIVDALGLGGSWVEGLLVDGVLTGVGGVLVFVPVLMSLFLALAVLEDSGYMARAAFVMDRMMRFFGLHGKSFLPMLVGFGCTVPAIYATRTLDNERDRILTGLLVPFMSCGARLPVYVLFAAVFFPDHAGTVVAGMYGIGIATAVVLGRVLKSSLLRADGQGAFVMELPPYRMPTARGIWTHMWQRTSSFLKKAWTVILGISVVLWLAMAVPVDGGPIGDTPVDSSAFAAVSGALAPAFKPLGFGSWEATGSLVTGFVAKEVVVATLAQVYGASASTDESASRAGDGSPSFLEDVATIISSFVEATIDTVKSLLLLVGIDLLDEATEDQPSSLMRAIRSGFEASSGGHAALAGLAFMVFVLLYTPCVVAVVAQSQEFGARWMWLSIVGQFVLAWLAGLVVFQGGTLLGLG